MAGKKTITTKVRVPVWVTLGVIAAALYFGYQAVKDDLRRPDVSVHSCRVYLPSQGRTETVWSSLSHLASSLVHFVRTEGVFKSPGALGPLLRDVVLSELGTLAPWPPLAKAQGAHGNSTLESAAHLKGKKMLVVGGAYIPLFFARAKQLGVSVHLLEGADRHKFGSVSHLVEKVIEVEDFGRVSIQEPRKVVEQVLASGEKYDAVTTLVEDQGILTAMLVEALGVQGSPLKAAQVARNKLKVRESMKELGLRTPKFHGVRSEDDLEAAAQAVGFPSFLKPIYGVAATFSSRVNSMEELRETYRAAQATVDPSKHAIYHFGSEMILEELVQGPEIQMEIMLSKGQLVYHSFSSQYAANRQHLVFPANLTKEQRHDMLSIAVATARDAVGLTDGIVHVELFLDARTGRAQLIEINNRLSRGFLTRRFGHLALFGETLVDYYAAVTFLANGVQPGFYQRKAVPTAMAVFLDEPNKVGWENEGWCRVYFGISPAQALDRGLADNAAAAE